MIVLSITTILSQKPRQCGNVHWRQIYWTHVHPVRPAAGAPAVSHLLLDSARYF